jgi:polygalacturonase
VLGAVPPQDSTQNVVLDANYIQTGDDCYALKSGWDAFGYTYGVPTTNVTISNGYCESPTSAGICIGSEMSGGVSNIRVWNMSIVNTGFAFRLKTGVGRGGYIRDVQFANSTVRNCSKAFEFSEFYGGHPVGGFDPLALPHVSAVLSTNITGDATVAGDLQGLPVVAPTGISFVDIAVTGSWSCRHVSGTVTNSPGVCPCLPSGC